jgi:hypothetical protein
MKSSELRSGIGVSRQSLEAAAETKLQVQATLDCCVTKTGQGVVMTGRNTHHVGIIIESCPEDTLQIRSQSCNLWREARLNLSLGPEQLLPKLCELSLLPLLPNDQLTLESRFPTLQLTPDMAVRESKGAGRRRDGATSLDRIEHLYERVMNQVITL